MLQSSGMGDANAPTSSSVSAPPRTQYVVSGWGGDRNVTPQRPLTTHCGHNTTELLFTVRVVPFGTGEKMGIGEYACRPQKNS